MNPANTLHLVGRRRGLSGTLVRVETHLEAGYVLRHAEGDRPSTITCLACGFTSANGTDVVEKYCARCQVFHERG